MGTKGFRRKGISISVANWKDHMAVLGTVELRRFNGVESYEVEEAEISVALEGEMLLSLSAPTAIKTLEDTIDLGAQPQASISIFSTNDWDSELTAGCKFNVPMAYDEKRERHVVEFSYVSFEDLNDNTIEVLERKNDRIRFLWQGRTQDMNYYDGSKPDAKFNANFWAKIVR